MLSVSAAATNDYNAATATVLIDVLYHFSGFLPPLASRDEFTAGQTIPVRFELTDALGDTITTLNAVTSLQIAAVNPNGSLGAPFSPQSANGQGIRVDGGQFQFDWRTAGLQPGAYEILLTLSDGSVQTMGVQMSARQDDHSHDLVVEVRPYSVIPSNAAASDSYFQALAKNDDDALSD
ncbi:MAG TPA: PxKF domain-containing protein [Pirellulales bacterium]|nr:PxKF domain-containing protein [Pirellulales bacterium]